MNRRIALKFEEIFKREKGLFGKLNERLTCFDSFFINLKGCPLRFGLDFLAKGALVKTGL
jgi:hypothetical protein